MLKGMDSPPEKPIGDQSRDGVTARAEALEIVLDALQWELAENRWATVEEALEGMEAAVLADDVRALGVATAKLELAGPLRIILIGPPEVPPVPQVRDRLIRLVHTLGGRPPSEPEKRQDDGERRGDPASH